MTKNTLISNWINGKICSAESGDAFEKVNPHNGQLLYKVTASSASDVKKAVEVAQSSFAVWSEFTAVHRGQILGNIVRLMRDRADDLAALVAIETGKSVKDAAGEVGGAIMQGDFFAGEGMRLYGRTLNSGMSQKSSYTVRQPHGVCGLIVPANTPIANIAWKVFPALICGNAVVLKASENAPKLALKIGELATEAGLPDGVLNVLQGLGGIAGRALVEDPRVPLISFTGSTNVGKWIAKTGGDRLARVSLELGGKNPFVVCEDADLERAVEWASLSAFSNAGQRCSSGSKILVSETVYDEFVGRLTEKAECLRMGVDEDCDLGPVVSQCQRDNILLAITQAVEEGGRIVTGGSAPSTGGLQNGFYIQPTLIEGLDFNATLPNQEIFGPVATLHKFGNLNEALEAANNSSYGLTASIHTTDIDRAMWFVQRVRAGAANINLATYGSEPHMPFGGFGLSGNGTREPGVEALDVYSEVKNISFLVRPDRV